MSADVFQLLVDRQNRLENRLENVENDVEEIPVLRKEVALLTKAVDRNTTALYTVVGTVVTTGAIGILFQQGVIG